MYPRSLDVHFVLTLCRLLISILHPPNFVLRVCVSVRARLWVGVFAQAIFR